MVTYRNISWKTDKSAAAADAAGLSAPAFKAKPAGLFFLLLTAVDRRHAASGKTAQ